MAMLRTKFFHLIHRMRRGLTLGVRAIVTRDEDTVLLVRHTYVPGWYLPGGGVEVGQTLYEALAKELMEEANTQLTDQAIFLHLFLNKTASNRDHVALFHCPSWVMDGDHAISNHEIAETRFFPMGDLPSDITPATQRRLTEFYGNQAFPALW